jgi:nitrate/nitrite transporter NarK
MIWVSNFAITAFFILFHLTFKEKPVNPPSAVALEDPPKKDMMESFIELKQNRNFRIIALAYAGLFGNYFAFGNLMSALLTPYGLTVAQISKIGVTTILTGAFSAILFGIFLDRTRWFKKSLIFFSVGSIFSLLLLTFYSLPSAENNFTALQMNCALYGAFLLPTIPLCMTFSTEVTHPM